MYVHDDLDGFTRGLCQECDTVRCDVAPTRCGDASATEADPTADWPVVPRHVVVPASERDDLERKWGITWCRRCGFMVVNDRYPTNITKRDCQVVKVNKQLFAWFIFAWVQTLVWMVVAIWALSR